MRKFRPLLGLTFKLALKLALGWAGFALLNLSAIAAPTEKPPSYRVDPFWPKELPGNLILHQVGGLAVDAHDNVWAFTRPRLSDARALGADQTPPLSFCCHSSPAVMEFDPAGNLIRSWGGPGYVKDWPEKEHGIYLDRSGNVWLAGNGPKDRQVLKFTADGKLLLDIGHATDAPRNNQDTSILGRPAGMFVDDDAHEIYIADGYYNSRVVVFDSDTGVFKRGWGAYGVPLDQISNTDQPAHQPNGAPARQFTGPVHCVRIAHDGLVYVCDRQGDRIQVFTKEGKFLKEFVFHPETLETGSAYVLVFSPDKDQKYIYLADGGDSIIGILRRSDGAVMGSFGHKGPYAGQFLDLHQMAMDSKGNLFTGEAGAENRLQRFVPVRAP